MIFRMGRRCEMDGHISYAGRDRHSKDGVLGTRETHQMMLYIKTSYCTQ